MFVYHALARKISLGYPCHKTQLLTALEDTISIRDMQRIAGGVGVANCANEHEDKYRLLDSEEWASASMRFSKAAILSLALQARP